jgi:hypothetical protein
MVSRMRLSVKLQCNACIVVISSIRTPRQDSNSDASCANLLLLLQSAHRLLKQRKGESDLSLRATILIGLVV